MNWFSRIFSKYNFSFFGLNWGPTPQYNDYTAERLKMQVVFSNPAVLKVFALQCDLFSLGKIYVYKDGKEIDNDPILKLFKNPNPFQSQAQFLWDYMFWTMLGTSYCYMDSNNPINDRNKLYFLDTSKLELPRNIECDVDKLVFSNAKYNSLEDNIVTYRYKDGSTFKFKLGKLLISFDLTNGTGNWFRSNSRIDALYKVISNSEFSLDAKNINVRYSGKFLVSGRQDPDNVTKMPMSGQEKESIEQMIDGFKNVHGIKSQIDINRFVSDLAALRLDESFLSDYYLIGSMYNIPRDVLEAYNSSTYENQEKAVARHITYTLEPKGQSFFDDITKRFGYDEAGKEIIIDWSHLPFMQVFEKDRAQVNEIKSKTFQNLVNSGVPIEEINEFLDLKFSKAEKYVRQTNTGQEQQGAN